MSDKRYLCQTVDPMIIVDPALKEEYDGLRRISQNWTYAEDEYLDIDKSLYRLLRTRYNDLPENPFAPSPPKEEKKGKKPKPPPIPKNEPEPDDGDDDGLIDIKPGMWVEYSGEWLGEVVDVFEEEEYLIVVVGDKQQNWGIDEDLQVFEEGWKPEPYFQPGDEVVVKKGHVSFTVKSIEIHKSLDPDKDRYTLHGLPATVLGSELVAPESKKLPGDFDMDELIKAVLENLKIREENLDENLLKKFNSTRSIRIKLPDQKTPEVPDNGIPAYYRILDDVIGGKNVFMVGGAGTGKTTLAEAVARSLSRAHQTVNCNQWTSPLELLGGETMEGYRDGKLTIAWREGQILILDELPKLDPNTAGILNEALSKSGQPDAVIQTPAGASIAKHKNFAVIATGNIFPNAEDVAYGANNKQDLSLLDRFVGCVYTIEENHSLEHSVTQSMMIWSIADRLRREIKSKQYESQISLRWMITARDAYLLEMDRANNPKDHDIKADEGKTLKNVINSFVETFDQVQQKHLYDVLNYSAHFSRYQYRKYEKNTPLY